MKKTRFTETQIIGILKETDAGIPVKEICQTSSLNVESAKVRAIQHLLSDIVWEEERILSRYHGMLSGRRCHRNNL